MQLWRETIQRYGFAFPRGELVNSPNEAVGIAKEIGFPVVLKVVSPDILHKSDVGGVKLNLSSPEDVETAFLQITDSVRQKMPQAKIDGVVVEEMCPVGIEVFIGLENNPQLGPIIAFGLGGVFVEILHDVAFRLLPISEYDARQMIKEIKGYKILQGYRGQPPVSEEVLLDLLMKASKMGLDLADRLEAIDLNPVLVWEDQHRVLDAKILLRDEPCPLKDEKPNTAHLDRFFNAKTVAVVGASATPGKIGHAILEGLVQHGYKGRVYPINPQKKEILGLRAYPSLEVIPDSVDLVVAATPLPTVPDLIRQCARKNVHNMVIVSGGGKELGSTGKALEVEILRLAKEAGLRIIGPNCIGIFNGETRLDTFFQPHERMERPPQGKIAILTQSGTVGVALLEKASGLGVSKFVSYGNRLDVDEGDLIAYLGHDPETDVIICYVEGIEKGRKFLAVAREVAVKKPIVVFKAGRTPQGAKASVSHTGFFGGTYGPWKGALAQAGLIAVDSVEELFATAKALAMQPPAYGNRVAMITNGAGPVVQAMDLLDSYGLCLANLSEESLKKMENAYPPYFVIQNPVDLTGSATARDYEAGLTVLLADDNVDIVMPWFVFQDAPLGEEIVSILRALSIKHRKPILCGAMGGNYTERISQQIEAIGVPVFHSVREWLSAAAGISKAYLQHWIE